jgi:hypothetical protein
MNAMPWACSTGARWRLVRLLLLGSTSLPARLYFCFSRSWKCLGGAMGWDETMVDDERNL